MEFNSLKEKYLFYREKIDYRLSSDAYVMVMLDGRSFSRKIKRGFKRENDEVFIKSFNEIMNETAKYVCENVSGCKIAYVQSDEINLVVHTTLPQEPFFANRICKLLSIIPSMATSKFNQLFTAYAFNTFCVSNSDAAETVKTLPLYEFDCKVWNVPTSNDAYAALLYRQNDCIRNSKEAVGQWKFSANELHKKKTDEQIAMVKEKYGVDWYTDFTEGEKYGRFIIPTKVQIYSDKAEGTIYRHRWEIYDAYPIGEENNRIKIMEFIENEKPIE